MSHSHDDGNYKHTATDLMEHEISKFAAQLNQLTVEMLTGTSFTPIQHCPKCETSETAYTKKKLDEMNKRIRKIQVEIEKIQENMKDRVKVLYPRVILAHPEFLEEETPPAVPADS